MPDQSGWCQIMWRDGPPTCEARDSSNKERVCPCRPSVPDVLFRVNVRMLNGERFELERRAAVGAMCDAGLARYCVSAAPPTRTHWAGFMCSPWIRTQLSLR